MNIAIVCGSFHKSEVSKMLEWASDEASQQGLTLTDVVWVPGAMEVPLALNRLLARDDIQGAACLGIIEKGHTQHGLAMGQSVMQSIMLNLNTSGHDWSHIPELRLPQSLRCPNP